MSASSEYIKKYARTLTAEEAPGIFRALAEIKAFGGEKCKVDHVKIIPFESFFDPSKSHTFESREIESLFIGSIVTTKKNGEKTLLLGKGLCQALGSSYGALELSPELRAVIGHELGHVLHGHSYKLPGVASAVIGAGAGLGATHLIKHLWDKHHIHHANDLTPEQKEAIAADLNHQQKRFTGTDTISMMGNAAIYLAGAAMGVTVMVAGMRGMNHRMELAADAFSANWMKDSKPLQHAFAKMSGMMENKRYLYNHNGRSAFFELKLIAGAEKGAEKAETFFNEENWVHRFFEKMFGSLTHPSDAKRIEKLEAMRF